ncbi:MAG: AAA family ATPase [Thermoanaerobaculia bacterium]
METLKSAPGEDERIEPSREKIASLRRAVHVSLVGQEHFLDRLLIGLLARGHVLVEGVPGLAKTLAIRALAGGVDARFSRIQFTPDLLPADLTGTLIFHPASGSFSPRLGPVFANIVLADEINRAPAKVQSALLEAMQERQVTIGDTTHLLPEPFFVLATQNPIEQEGTYPLPEAQTDRFLLKCVVRYPSREEELRILEIAAGGFPPLSPPVISTADLTEAADAVAGLYADRRIREYIVALSAATRSPRESGFAEGAPWIAYGASPRGSIAILAAARGHAFLQGRSFVVPEDVKAIAHDTLRHRLVLTFEAEAEGIRADDVIERLLGKIPVP